MFKTLRALAAAALLAFALPALAQAPATQAPAKVAPAKPAAVAPAPAAAAKPDLLDINTASPEQLQALKGVGDVRAKAIVAGRPYKGKDELWQKKIIPKGVYNAIKDLIIARQK
jgi:DNA uptake protein ComE-like DNA-binding protein